MKRFICFLLIASSVFMLFSCSEESSIGSGEIDIDLTKLSSTMIYSEVYNMMMTPGEYVGKMIKMNGMFGVYYDETTKKNYFACVIADATACCSQGIEFVLNGDPKYPDEYPDLGTEITVTGKFEIYKENGYEYCHLVGAELI